MNLCSLAKQFKADMNGETAPISLKRKELLCKLDIFSGGMLFFYFHSCLMALRYSYTFTDLAN